MSEGPGQIRRARVVVAAVVVILVAGAAFWAGRVTFRPPDAIAQQPASSAQVDVIEQELGRVLTLTTTVTRPKAPLALNGLSGVVTSVPRVDEYEAGDVLYTVGDRAVALAEGGTPFWRELSQGARGEDVRQVQQMLTTTGATLDVDGIWSAATTAALREWQRGIGTPATGSLALGELIAAPDLPARLSTDPQVLWPGAVLAGGEVVVAAPTGEPSFLMEVTQTQAEMIPEGTQVTVHGEASWAGVVTGSQVSDQGANLTIAAPGGGVVCGTECALLPAADSSYLLTDVMITPPVRGPVVPVAALSVGPDSETTVGIVGPDGSVEERTVTVRVVADGLAVVDGVQVGERVRALDAKPTPPSPADAEP